MSEEMILANKQNGSRWHDNQDGTITDLTSGLIWLKRADWGGAYFWWADSIDKINAHDRASSLKADIIEAGLTDSSVEGDWRLPTLSELKSLTTGDEGVSTWDMRIFTGVEPTPYWSSTSDSSYLSRGYFVHLISGTVGTFNKKTNYHVWPVRGKK